MVVDTFFFKESPIKTIKYLDNYNFFPKEELIIKQYFLKKNNIIHTNCEHVKYIRSIELKI